MICKRNSATLSAESSDFFLTAMAQNYEVFLRDKKIYLIGENFKIPRDNATLYVKYDSKENLLNKYELLVSEPAIKILCISHHDTQKLWNEFLSLFEIIEAAGGVVKNNSGEVLMIFRKEKWDLPKGKLEKKEKPEEAAVREVEEECGIPGVKIKKQAPMTYHSYKLSEKKMLKRTYWYEMNYTGNKKPSPQKEEDITEVKWMKKDEIRKALKNSYPLIEEVLRNEI